MSVHWSIIRRLLSHPLRVTVVDDRRSYKGIEIIVAALHVAGAIDRVCKTRTVAMLVPSSGAAPIIALAAWFLGKTVVPLNFLLKDHDLQYVVDHCGADTIVAVDALLEHMATTPHCDNLIRLEELSFSGVPPLRIPARSADDDLAVILYTSGTSGRPKGVMLTHGNLLANVRQIRRWVDFSADDILVGVLPQFHCFGFTVLTLLPLMAGPRVVYSARFQPRKIIGLIREHRATAFIGIPSMFKALLQVKDAGPDDLRTLRYAVSGGEPLPDAVAEQFEQRFAVTLNEGYGLTETAPVTNWCRPEEYRKHSVGPPLPDVEERIVDIDTEEVLGPDSIGELRIKGPNVMRGYYHADEATEASFDEAGFLKTGDMARLDSAGHLYITGRLKEMLIVGGENVFPREIELVIDQHPAIAASGVVGIRDELRGEVPVAFVELAEGESFDEASIIAHCRERLTNYRVPRRVYRLDTMPRSPIGKIMRRELKSMVEQGALPQDQNQPSKSE